MKYLTEHGRSNVERLVNLLKSRLHSSGKMPARDGSDVLVNVDYDIYQLKDLHAFLELSLSEFNQTPKFSQFSFEEMGFVETFTDILVEGAALHALASQALIERGREYTVMDNGVFLDQPSLADLIERQYETLLKEHVRKLNNIKLNIDSFESCEDEEECDEEK